MKHLDYLGFKTNSFVILYYALNKYMNKNAIKVLIYAYLSQLFKMTNSRVLGNIFGPQIRAWGTLMHFFQLCGMGVDH